VKVDREVLDSASVITKLKRALNSARARAHSWREAAKYQHEVLAASQRILAEVQEQRDFLLNRCNELEETAAELEAYNKVLQWRVDSQPSIPPNPPASRADVEYQQAMSLMRAGQANQQFAQQNQLNPYQESLRNIIGSQIHSATDWCNCVPARHDMFLNGR
jgi:hypothetical protein